MNVTNYMHLHTGDHPKVSFGDTQPVIRIGTQHANVVVFIEALPDDDLELFIATGMQAFLEANDWYNERKAHNDLDT